jgi:4-hydroxy-4-methyl-2-oxoglutarate aldolase
MNMVSKRIGHSQLLQLKRFNTPTIYNGWEQITRRDIARDCFNLEETIDFMPQMGSMIGHAVTLVIEPSQSRYKKDNPRAWSEYRRYMAGVAGPKIVVIQDLDKPLVLGSFWGEVNGNIHRALGCVGTITDGGIRDLDEMHNAGFKALARRLCVGHAHVTPVEWGGEVEVFGCRIRPGQLIHADKHGFLAIPIEDEDKLLEAVQFMDINECDTVIKAARNSAGLSAADILDRFDRAGAAFDQAVRKRFSEGGEWN